MKEGSIWNYLQVTQIEALRAQWPRCCDNNKDEESNMNVNSVNNSKSSFSGLYTTDF